MPSINEYYDMEPGLEHRPGDIWSDLPTQGLLSLPSTAGIVITPACDLSNCKSETITYLPVIPILSFFGTVGATADIKKAISGQLRVASIQDVPLDLARATPSNDILKLAEDRIAAILSQPGISEKIILALNRGKAGVRLLRNICSATPGEAAINDLKGLFGESGWEELLERTITNARADSHFLPRDRQRPEWSGVLKHSIVLFRYPLTAPLSVFNFAQDSSITNWEDFATQLSTTVPLAREFAKNRPIKRVSLKTPFIEDMLTRYSMLYSRLGSPSFDPDTVSRFIREVGE